MTAFICETCGVQYAPGTDSPNEPPARCVVCEDERQYVGHRGQRWTTIEQLRDNGRRNVVTEVEPDLVAIATTPSFAIGQRAYVIRTPVGNVMWESTSLVDEASIAAVRALGGVRAIAISHPHFYSAMVDWSRALGDAPIWLHAADREWVRRPDAAIQHWDGETTELLPGSGLTLIRVGGHFPGNTDLLWPAGAEGRGVLFTGDMPQVARDRRWVSFLYSYPNMIPLPPAEVARIAATLGRHRFDRIYGSWADTVVETDAAAAVARSAERYRKHVGGGVG